MGGSVGFMLMGLLRGEFFLFFFSWHFLSLFIPECVKRANLLRQHWMQQHLDRLAYTFGRRITGVHNRT